MKKRNLRFCLATIAKQVGAGLCIVIATVLAPVSQAEDGAATAPSDPAKAAVESKHTFKDEKIDGRYMEMKGDVINGSYMDFKGDVIEGSRKSPGALVELGSKDPNLESLIYSRPDFSDFHEQERGRARLKPQPR